jgi:hypothetical protein
MFKVDVPARMSTPGQSISGADAVREAGCVTPGVALEKKPVNRLPNELSDDPVRESVEQPASAAALTNSANVRQEQRLGLLSKPGRIEITRLFSTKSPPPDAL